MTGKQIDDVGELSAIYEVSEHDTWNLVVDMKDTKTDELWGELDEFDKPGKYALVRLDK